MEIQSTPTPLNTFSYQSLWPECPLPSDLVLEIFRHLSLLEVKSFRLVCKQATVFFKQLNEISKRRLGLTIWERFTSQTSNPYHIHFLLNSDQHRKASLAMKYELISGFSLNETAQQLRFDFFQELENRVSITKYNKQDPSVAFELHGTIYPHHFTNFTSNIKSLFCWNQSKIAIKCLINDEWQSFELNSAKGPHPEIKCSDCYIQPQNNSPVAALGLSDGRVGVVNFSKHEMHLIGPFSAEKNNSCKEVIWMDSESQVLLLLLNQSLHVVNSSTGKSINSFPMSGASMKLYQKNKETFAAVFSIGFQHDTISFYQIQTGYTFKFLAKSEIFLYQIIGANILQLEEGGLLVVNSYDSQRSQLITTFWDLATGRWLHSTSCAAKNGNVGWSYATATYSDISSINYSLYAAVAPTNNAPVEVPRRSFSYGHTLLPTDIQCIMKISKTIKE